MEAEESAIPRDQQISVRSTTLNPLNDEDHTCVIEFEPKTVTRHQRFSIIERIDQDGRLYDREEQTEALLAAFERRLDGAERELVLICGVSGTGKTRLAQVLRSHVGDGYFISGKFDLMQRADGYPAIVSAFTDLVGEVLRRGDAERIRKLVEEEFSTEEIQMLNRAFPPIQQIIPQVGDSPQSAKGANAQSRFQKIFSRFVAAISSRENPLVLFLDDLQWADMGSIELLVHAAKEMGAQGLMLLGACRDNEVSLHDPLSASLRQLETDGVRVTDIEVANLRDHAVNELISDHLKVPNKRSRSLTDVVVNCTDGNIFFLKQILITLEEEGYLNLEGDGFTWDRNVLETDLAGTTDVVDMIADKMRRLDDSSRTLLMYASCLGAAFKEYLLHETELEGVDVALASVVEKGFIAGDGPGSYRWVHDRVQQAAYSLIPADSVSLFHLELGRQLRRNLRPSELQSHLFLVVNQLCHGADLIDEDERQEVALLCLSSGQKATRASAFITGLTFFDRGLALLGGRHWRDEYDLSLELHNSAAEVAYTCAAFDRVDELVANIEENARCFRDTLRAWTTKIYSLGARHKLQEAIEIAIDILEPLGVKLPHRRIGALRHLTAIIKIRNLLHGKSTEDILCLPPMTDQDKLSAMRIMNIIMPYTYFTQEAMATFINLRLLELTMKYGLSSMSALGVAFYAISCCVGKQHDEGSMHGQLSLSIVDKFNGREWESRVSGTIYGMVAPWTQPSQNVLAPLRHAHMLGLATGDIEYACLNACHVIAASVHGGEPMLPRLPEFLGYLDLIKTYGQNGVQSLYAPYLQLVLNLTGEERSSNSAPLALSGKAQDEEGAFREARSQKNTTVLSIQYHVKALLALYLGQYDAAWDLALLMRKHAGIVNPPMTIFNQLFLEAIAASLCRKKRKRFILQKIKALEASGRFCPSNVRGKILLIEAQLAAMQGKVDDALDLFHESIAFAGEQGTLHERALAYELAGNMLNKGGRASESKRLFDCASKLYGDWGALVKVEMVNERLE